MAKTNKFVITNWNLNSEEVFRRYDDKIRYLAYGLETCPSTGRKHHQSFIIFYNQRSTRPKNLDAIGKMFKLKETDVHCNVEPMYGSLKSNEKYCSKESELKTLGDPPKQGARNDLDKLKVEIFNGKTVDEICEENPEMYHQYGRTLEKLEDIYLRKQYRQEMTECEWIYGPTGVGKSHRAFEGYNPKTHYVKNLNEDWWDGYTGQEVVILNEFRGQIKFSELLDLADKWPKTVKRRNRQPAPFLAKKLIITSSKPPDEIYVNCIDSLNQLDRRTTVINLTETGCEVLSR